MKHTPISFLNCFIACVLGVVIAGAGIAMDGPDELEAAQDVADYKAALADGGMSLCAEFGRVPTWTKGGDLVCRASVVVAGSKP